jgi:hypothetical protein
VAAAAAGAVDRRCALSATVHASPADPQAPRWALSRLSWAIVALGGVVVGISAALDPTEARAAFSGPLVAWVICELLVRTVRRRRDGERLARLLCWAMALRIVFSLVHIAVAVWLQGGGRDLKGYMEASGIVLDHLASGTLSREVILVQAGDGSTTTASTAVVVAVVALLGGHTMWSVFLVVSAVSTVSAYLFLRAYQRALPHAAGQRFLTLALLFLPAVGFWSVFVGKDFISFAMLAWSAHAVAGLLRRSNARDVFGIGASTLVLVTVRPHMALVTTVAAAAALVMNRTRPAMGDRAAVAVVLALMVVSGAMPSLTMAGVEEVTVEAIAERVQSTHQGYADTEGATTLPLAIEEPTPGAILRFLPLGLYTLVFRPYVWEAHNALAVAAGAENLLVLGLVLWRWRTLVGSVRAALAEPFLLYVIMTFVGGGTILSLAWNLGTMARLRTMVMPFLLILLAGSHRPAVRFK